MAEDREAIWELKTESIDTHLCPETGEKQDTRVRENSP